ncbi:MAG: translocation/assembly module TamB domain-containing protein [Candidatus Omnitrophica bacterium]|nr:translocation/assembly module TamB domain-containing protein [Candidatus Omnitrophota bacterium]
MHHFRRLLTAVFLTLFSVILLLSLALGYLIVTPVGGKLLVRYFKQQFAAVGLMHVGHYEGDLRRGFVLSEVSIKGLAYLPKALLRIQEVRVQLDWRDMAHPDADIFNARLFMPGSDPVVFTGRIQGGEIKGSLFAKSVDLHTISRFWPSVDVGENLHGYVSDVNLTLQGPLLSPRATGTFLIDEAWYGSVFLTDDFSRGDVVLFPLAPQLQMKGEVTIDSGLVKIRNTSLQLAPSKLDFKGDVLNPVLDLHLGARVEDMEIRLAITGPMNYPKMAVSSDPPMAPQEALQVLFTNNAWTSSTSPFYAGTSTELAENFLSYSLQDVNSKQQFGLKRRLTKRLRLGVEMDQMTSQPGQTNIYYTRRVDGEFDLDDHMSLNVSQQVFPQDSYPSASYQDADQRADTQFYLKYKKRF